RLELDHVRAHVGEIHRAIGRGHGLREVDDSRAVQRFHVISIALYYLSARLAARRGLPRQATATSRRFLIADVPDAAVVAVPEIDVFDGVEADVGDLLVRHLAHGLGGHAHDQPARGHHLALRHHRAGADLGILLHHRPGEHHRPDADAHVVHDGAGMHHAAMPDGHAGPHDAGELGRDVEHGVVLDIGVAAQAHVVVLIAAQDAEGPDAGALLDGHIADHLRRDVHEGAGM